MRSMNHDRGDRRFDAVKDASNQRHVAKGNVDPRKRDQDKQ